MANWTEWMNAGSNEITLYEVGTGTTQNTATIDNALTQIVRTLNGGYAGYGIGFCMEIKDIFKKAKYKTGTSTGAVYAYGLNKGTDGLYSTDLVTQIIYEKSPTADMESDEIDISSYDAFFIIVLSTYQGNVRGLTYLKLYN